jgi:hypothetical protein
MPLYLMGGGAETNLSLSLVPLGIIPAWRWFTEGKAVYLLKGYS